MKKKWSLGQKLPRFFPPLTKRKTNNNKKIAFNPMLTICHFLNHTSAICVLYQDLFFFSFKNWPEEAAGNNLKRKQNFSLQVDWELLVDSPRLFKGNRAVFLFYFTSKPSIIFFPFCAFSSCLLQAMSSQVYGWAGAEQVLSCCGAELRIG